MEKVRPEIIMKDPLENSEESFLYLTGPFLHVMMSPIVVSPERGQDQGGPVLLQSRVCVVLTVERLHDTSPGDFESMSIKAGDSETKEGLKREEARS